MIKQGNGQTPNQSLQPTLTRGSASCHSAFGVTARGHNAAELNPLGSTVKSIVKFLTSQTVLLSVAITLGLAESPKVMVEGVLQKGCEQAQFEGECEEFYFIDLPKRLDELVLGKLTMTEKECAEHSMPMWCARSIQVFSSSKQFRLESLLGSTIKVSGSAFDDETAHHHRPAILTVNKLDVIKEPK